MAAEDTLSFPPFHLNLLEERLWRAGRPVRLRQKPFQVLRHLAERPGRVVTSEDLLSAVWPGVSVSPTVLKVCVREIRLALRDHPRRARYIATVRGRGYQFVAEIDSRAAPIESGPRRASQAPSSVALGTRTTGAGRGPRSFFVGRESELAELDLRATRALHGTRQMVFLTGEPGIGKTTTVDVFLQKFDARRRMRLLSGRCVQQYGVSEAYAPVLEALERLCREERSDEPLRILRRRAPAWLAELSTLLEPIEQKDASGRSGATTQERMLREIAGALEELAARRGLILWLEDLQWSDPSTLDLLSYLARRPDPARLLVIGTYRRTEVLTSEHPLREIVPDLQVHGLCSELPLDFLSQAETAQYLSRRFDWPVPPEALVRLVHRRTDGSPLFLVNVVDDLITRGALALQDGAWTVRGELEAAPIPSSVSQLIEQQIARLDANESRILEAASVAGLEFSAAAAAAALEIDVAQVEETCEALCRRETFLRADGEEDWPDGTTASRYRFEHVLHREALYERLPAARRRALHERLLLCKEAAFGGRSEEIAAELAMHAEQARDGGRAFRYLREAGERAARSYANREAVVYLDRALAWIGKREESAERDLEEIRVRQSLSVPLANTLGYAAPPLETNLERLKELTEKIGESGVHFSTTLGMWTLRLVRGELSQALELGNRLLRLAERAKSPLLLLQAHRALGHTHFYRGDFRKAQEHLDQALADYDVDSHVPLSASQGDDPVVLCLAYSSWTLWHLGEPELARENSTRAVTLARKLDQPSSLAFALGFQAVLHQLNGATETVLERAEALLALAADEGFLFWLAWGWILRGWAWAAEGRFDEGLAQIHQGLGTWQATGAELGRPYTFALLAEAYAAAGRVEDALGAIAAALDLAERTGDRWHEAEIHRLRAELLGHSPHASA